MPNMVLQLQLLPVALAGLGGAAAVPRLQPDWGWSWAKIPSWASGQGATNFTENVTRYYADNFDIMWTQGTSARTRGTTDPNYATWEAGTVSDCKKIHAMRPGMPTFGYCEC